MPINRTQTSPVTTPRLNTTSAPAKKPAVAQTQTANVGWGAQSAPKLPGVNAQIRELGMITSAAKAGTLNPAQVEAKLAKLKALPDAEGQALWSPGNAPKRAEFIAAYKALANAAPSSHLPTNPVNGHRATTKENLLQLQFVDAQASRDPAKMKEVAKEFKREFPTSPTNTWVQGIAAGGGSFGGGGSSGGW